MVAALGALLAVHQKKNSRSIGELVAQDLSIAGYWAILVDLVLSRIQVHLKAVAVCCQALYGGAGIPESVGRMG